MNAKRNTVQHLIDSLDDARLLYEKATDKVADPRLRDLLDCTIGRHWLIADDLARQIVRSSGGMARRGSRLRWLRSFLAEKFTRHSGDSDMAYVSQAVKCETALLRDFRQVVASGHSAGLRWRLRVHCREIERAAAEVDRLRASLGMKVVAQTRAGGHSYAGSMRAPACSTLVANRHHAVA